jgi:hypothetical protein
MVCPFIQYEGPRWEAGVLLPDFLFTSGELPLQILFEEKTGWIPEPV